MNNEPQYVCCKSPCPLTMGYYIGGGLYMCWMHVMHVPGLLDAVIEQGQDPIGLTPTCTFEESIRRFGDSYKPGSEQMCSKMVSDIEDRIDEGVRRLQQGHPVKART